jgi:hypothetical protein
LGVYSVIGPRARLSCTPARQTLRRAPVFTNAVAQRGKNLFACSLSCTRAWRHGPSPHQVNLDESWLTRQRILYEAEPLLLDEVLLQMLGHRSTPLTILLS